MDKGSGKFLVADIGGTNSRFAIAHCKLSAMDDGGGAQSSSSVFLSEQQQFASADFGSLTEAINAYLVCLSEPYALSQACIAVAGPVSDSSVKLTNLHWQSSANELATELQFEHLKLLNDFAAYAYSVPHLNSEHRLQIKSGVVDEVSPMLVLGPGTGFGVASLIPMGEGRQVIACEGGHISLGATNQQELKIIQLLMTQTGRRVTVEDLLCGSGLLRLYQTMAEALQLPATCTSPEQISAAAILANDPLAVKTLKQFCRWLGGVAGDIALAQGTRGGVCLGGGILPRFSDFLLESDFVAAFTDKGPMANYMQSIPVSLVTKSDTALLGAAHWYIDRVIRS